MNNARVFKMSFAGVYPHYIHKAKKKGRTKAEVDAILFWLTGYDEQALQQIIDRKHYTKNIYVLYFATLRLCVKIVARKDAEPQSS